MSQRVPALLATLVATALMGAVAPAMAAGLNTTITSGPKGLLASRTATFRFKASVPGASFQCQLDSKSWSSCASPKRYSKLSQGAHTFRVRASKAGSVDRTPATRSFKVDTVKPQTVIQTGPSGEIDDPTPTFTFSSSEPGTFQCRVLTTLAFRTCPSPFTTSALNDGAYTLRVRARDKAGNLDATPATRSFTVERILTADLAGARAVAETYFPDELVMDVSPNCGPAPAEIDQTKVDCLNDVPLAGADQLLISSDRNVVESSPLNYDVTVTTDVSTLSPVLVNRLTLSCATALTSAYGDDATWTITMDLTFDLDPGSGKPRATYTGLDVTGVEPEDWGVGSWPGVATTNCGFPGTFTSDFIGNVYTWILDTHMNELGAPMCAVTGPEYLGECA
jgi:hypothetical protein